MLALPSSGLHSNGFSLARAVIKQLNCDLNSDFNGKALIDVLLEPTRIYVDEFLRLNDYINALAHITGGGISENLPRILPAGLGARIQKSKIKMPEIFKLISREVNESEMERTFNCGVGMILVVSSKNASHILANTDAYEIGEIIAGNGVEYVK